MALTRVRGLDADRDATMFGAVQGVDDDEVGQGVACEVDGFPRRRDEFGVDGVEAFLGTEVDLLGAGLGGADQRDGEEGDSGR